MFIFINRSEFIEHVKLSSCLAPLVAVVAPPLDTVRQRSIRGGLFASRARRALNKKQKHCVVVVIVSRRGLFASRAGRALKTTHFVLQL